MRQHLRAAMRPTHLRPLALAAAMLMASHAQAQVPAPSFTQDGANSTTGNPSGLPFVGNPASLNFGTDTVYIANGAPGSFAALSGAVLQAGALSVANSGTGVGTFTATGVNAGTGVRTQVLLGGTGNRLEVGNWGTGTLTVSAGALLDATVNSAACTAPGSSCFNFIGNAAGSTATLNVTGAGSELRTLRGFIVGAPGVFTQAVNGFDFGTPGGTTNAFVNVLAGGKLSTQQATVGQGPNNAAALGTEKGFGTVVVNGVGSQWDVKYNSIDNTAAGITIGNRVGGDGKVTISNGAKLRVDGTGSPAGQVDFITLGLNGGSGSLTVTGGGSSLDMAGFSGAIQAGRSGAGAASSFSVLAGASASAIFLNIGRDGATGTALLDGAGTQLQMSGQGLYSQGGLGSAASSIGWGGSGQVTVSNGALWHISDGGTNSSASNRGPGITLGASSGVGAGNGSLTITGANSRVEVVSTSIAPVGGAADNGNSFVNVGRDSGSTGSVNISAGGKLLITGNAVSTPIATRTTYLGIGGNSDTTAGGTGTFTISGPGSEARITGSDAYVTVGRSGTGTMTLSNGALLEATILNVGRAASSNGTLTMDASTMLLNGQFTDSIGSGAGFSLGNRGGTGSMTMNNGSVVSITNLGTAGAGLNLGGTGPNPLGTGTLTMNGGSQITVAAAPGLAGASIGRDGTGLATLRGGSSIDIGDGSVHVGRLSTGIGTANVQSGSKILAGSINIGGSSDVDLGGIGTVTVTGAGSELRASGPSGFIGVGRGGNGTLNLSDQGKVSAIVMSVGRAAGGTGVLNAQNATIELSGQQTSGLQAGAGLAVGSGGGTGVATLVNSTVNVTNLGAAGGGINVGGSGNFPLGTGTLNMSNSQITVNAAPGQGGVNIGRSGTGIATLNASSITNTDGNVFVAREVGSSGTLVLNANSVVSAGFVGVGVSAPGVGNALGPKGGTGTLVLNNSTINTKRFELGEGSVLTGNNGTISAGVDGPVIIGGIVSPGNSPGRLRIKCDVTMLPTSKLILEINDKDGGPGVDFDIDELIIGDDSKFDLTSLQIVFSFIGSTNPNEFAASEGGFNLDRFLLASGPDDEILGGLSTLFGNKRNPDTLNWGQAVNSQLFAFESTVYDVSETAFNPDTGRIEVTATAKIPEPASMALVLLALAAMAITRRRKAQAAQAWS
jgi:T5SS/PEP-CTERM-associated repeat protein